MFRTPDRPRTRSASRSGTVQELWCSPATGTQSPRRRRSRRWEAATSRSTSDVGLLTNSLLRATGGEKATCPTMRSVENCTRIFAALLGVAVLTLALVIGPAAGPAWAVSGAAFTTFDAVLGGCLDSPNGVNCNHYTGKDRVYMSGGPTKAGLSDGNYFFAVLTPGSQNGGFFDGATGNLSDTTTGGTTGDSGSGDSVANRTFTVVNHQITTYVGTHAMGTSPNGHPIIGLAPFDDTDNPGGVYILAICKVGATSPSECKYDAFKVDTPNPPAVAELIVTKDADASHDRTFHWSIEKKVDKTLVKQVGGSATFNYSVSVTHDSGIVSNWQVNGTITVTNPNPAGDGANKPS